jgi:hypothetical protein
MRAPLGAGSRQRQRLRWGYELGDTRHTRGVSYKATTVGFYSVSLDKSIVQVSSLHDFFFDDCYNIYNPLECLRCLVLSLRVGTL